MITQAQFDEFLATLKYPPNPFQRAILESVAFETSGHIVVSALAGSGKTSLLMMLARLFNVMGQPTATFLAFNKKIRDEMNDRLPDNYRAINSHSLGLNILKTRVTKTRLDYKKWPNLCRELVSPYVPRRALYHSAKALEKLCSKVMLNAVDPNDEAAVAGIARRYRILGEDANPITITLVPTALQRAQEIWEGTGAVSFDEMLYLPVKLKIPPPQFDFVLVDESQDLNTLQQDIAFASLKKDGRYIFVGDKNQAMYGFAGADAASFDRITDTTGAKVYPLNTCYRCPSKHIEIARRIVPHLEAAPNAPEGEIAYIKADQLYSQVKPGVLVMCRLNAPLISAYFGLISKQIKAKVMGKDIGRDLVNTLEKVADFDGFQYEKMIEYLEVYRKQQLHNLEQQDANESQVELLNDKVDCLVVCVENFVGVKTLDSLKDVLLDLFGDDDDEKWNTLVALCTVHKAKGLEAEETFILRPEKMPLTWPDQAQWEFQQELNIKYVALTRATRKMTVVITKDDQIGCLGENLPPVPKPEVKIERVPEPVPEVKPVLPAPVVIEAANEGEPEPETTEETVIAEPVEAKNEGREPVEITPVPAPNTQTVRLMKLLETLSVTELDTLAAVIAEVRSQKAAVHV